MLTSEKAAETQPSPLSTKKKEKMVKEEWRSNSQNINSRNISTIKTI